MTVYKTADKYTNRFNAENVNFIFARNMRARRKELGLSQEKLGQEADLHTNYIGGIEQCVRNPTAKSMSLIADALKLPLSVLLSKEFAADEVSYGIVEYGKNSYNVTNISKSEAEKIIQSNSNTS